MDGGQTPEELETLLEDALVLGDSATLVRLFKASGVLVPNQGPPARGRDEIARLAADLRYLAAPRHVVQASDTALVVGTHGLTVARRGRDRTWRYAIVLLGDVRHGSIGAWESTRTTC